MWPLSFATGATSAGSSASVCSVKFSGTFQMKTLPSSEADEMSESLKGLLRTVSAVPAPLVCCVAVPVGVEDGGSVPAEERQLVGGAAALTEGDDGESTAAAGLPVDRDVFRVGLECVSAGGTRSRAVS
jgi:hypothetical protein